MQNQLDLVGDEVKIALMFFVTTLFTTSPASVALALFPIKTNWS